MGGAAAALFAVGSAAVGAVVSVGAGIAGTLVAVGSAVVGTLTAIASTLTSALAGLTSTIAGVLKGIGLGIYDTLAGMVNIAVDIIKLPAALITGDLDIALANLMTTIDFEVTALAGLLNNSITALAMEVTKWVAVTKLALSGKITHIMGVVGETTAATLAAIEESLETVKGAVDSIAETVETGVTTAAKLREVISDIASLKIVDEMLKDVSDISDLLDPIANGQFMKTAQAIATLARAIVGTTVATMDKIDAERRLLGATIDTFDEQIATSIKDQMELAKAEVMTIVTPKMTTLGRNQEMVIKGIARLSRHIEDESWFVAMFLRMLR